MLNSGEVPGMYSSDEKDKICTDIRDWLLDKGGNPTKVCEWADDVATRLVLLVCHVAGFSDDHMPANLTFTSFVHLILHTRTITYTRTNNTGRQLCRVHSARA